MRWLWQRSFIMLISIIIRSSQYWDETYNYADTFTNNTHLKPWEIHNLVVHRFIVSLTIKTYRNQPLLSGLRCIQQLRRHGSASLESYFKSHAIEIHFFLLGWDVQLRWYVHKQHKSQAVRNSQFSSASPYCESDDQNLSKLATFIRTSLHSAVTSPWARLFGIVF